MNRPLSRRLLVALLGTAAAPARAQTGAQTGPQPELPKERLVILGRDGARHAFLVELALTPEQQSTGLMFRPSLPPDGGMLFDWGTPRRSTMWMRNTIIPLDMLFIAADGRVHHIAERTVPYSLATISSNGPVRATLELAGGTAERLNIRVGDQVLHPIFGTSP